MSHLRMPSPLMPMPHQRLVGLSRPTAHSPRLPRRHPQNARFLSLASQLPLLLLVTAMASPPQVPAALRQQRLRPRPSLPAHHATGSCPPADSLGAPHHMRCFRQEAQLLATMQHQQHHAHPLEVSRQCTTWLGNSLHGAHQQVLSWAVRMSVLGYVRS